MLDTADTAGELNGRDVEEFFKTRLNINVGCRNNTDILSQVIKFYNILNFISTGERMDKCRLMHFKETETDQVVSQ